MRPSELVMLLLPRKFLSAILRISGRLLSVLFGKKRKSGKNPERINKTEKYGYSKRDASGISLFLINKVSLRGKPVRFVSCISETVRRNTWKKQKFLQA